MKNLISTVLSDLNKFGFCRIKVEGGYITADEDGREVIKTIGSLSKHIALEAQILEGFKLAKINRNDVVVSITSFDFENSVYIPLAYHSDYVHYPNATDDALMHAACDLTDPLRSALVEAWECIHLGIYEGWEMDGLITWPLEQPGFNRRVHFRWKVLDHCRFPELSV